MELDNEYILNRTEGKTSLPPSEMYTDCAVVNQLTKDKKHQIVTGSRTIIDNILLWLNCLSTSLLMFECVCKVFMKYRVTFKL